MGTDDNAPARCRKLTIASVSPATGMDLDLLQVHCAPSVVSDADQHWVNGKGVISLRERERENCIISLLILRLTYYFRD